MEYQQKEKYDRLEYLLQLNHTKRVRQEPDSRTQEADFLWDASRFWANILYLSEPSERFRTKSELEAFAVSYQNQTGIQVDTEVLFRKFWLREVLGFVHIASAIRSALPIFREVKEYKEELKFINEFHQIHDKTKFEVTVPIETLKEAVANYEQQHQANLNREKVLYNRWCTQKDGKVKFASIDIYYAPYLQYWDEFCFLAAWQDAKASEDERLLITKESFELVQQSFSHLRDFSTVDVLKQQKIVVDIVGKEQYYSIEFYNTEINYWHDLQDKITGYYWEMLFQDVTVPCVQTKVKTWLTKALYGSDWPNHLAYVTNAAKRGFLDAGLQLITESADIIGIKEEYRKVRLDSEEDRGVSVLSIPAQRHAFDTKLNNADLFELLSSLHLFETRARQTLFYSQSARNHLAFLIRTIIMQDPEWDRDELAQTPAAERKYWRVKELLEQSISKPFILWDVTRFIILARNELIPALLIEPFTAPLALFLIDEIQSETTLTESILTDVWKLATELALECLIEPPIENASLAKAVFQMYWLVHRKEFGRLDGRQKQSANFYQVRKSAVVEIIENFPSERTYYRREKPPYLLPVLYTSLATVFLQYKEPAIYNNNTIQLPLLKWNGLFWLLKIATSWKYKKQFTKVRNETDKITRHFLHEYLVIMEERETIVYDEFERKEVSRFPLWSEKMFRLRLANWKYAVYHLYETGTFNQLLSPRFDFVVTDGMELELHEKKIAYNTDKLRTHIGVLLQVLQQFTTPSTAYEFSLEKVAKIRTGTENQIIDFLRNYTSSKPEEGGVDILDYDLEWRFQSSDDEALLPQIAKAINWFTDRKTIIDTLIETSDIIKLLVLLDYIASEGIKRAIIERIKASKITHYLQNFSWIPQIQTVLTKLSGYPEFLPQITESVTFWEKQVIARKDDKTYKELLYQTQLLIAYYRKDEVELRKVPAPGEFHGSRSNFSYQSYKDFYLGLLFIESDPAKAHHIFSDLVNQYPDYPTLGLNKLAAKVQMASGAQSKELFIEALEEWQTLEDNQYKGKDLRGIEPDLTASLMAIHLALGEHEKLDELYSKLSTPDKMQPSILSNKFDSLLVRNKMEEATGLLESARIYHHSSDTSEAAFIQELELKLTNRDDVPDLRNQYARIFRNTPQKVVRILPAYYNGKENLQEFLVKEIIIACNKLLTKINSLNKIDDEDKYNDLVESVLDARLNWLGWHVGEQSRGGFPGRTGINSKTKDTGERDLPIFDTNKKCLMLCEALIYRGTSTAVSHLTKLFNYEHQRQAFTILYYDNGFIKKGFERNWNDYTRTVFPKTKFPDAFKISEPISDMTADFDCINSGVRVGKSLHGNDAVIYHIFVNINYKL